MSSTHNVASGNNNSVFHGRCSGNTQIKAPTVTLQSPAASTLQSIAGLVTLAKFSFEVSSTPAKFKIFSILSVAPGPTVPSNLPLHSIWVPVPVSSSKSSPVVSTVSPGDGMAAPSNNHSVAAEALAAAITLKANTATTASPTV